MVILDVYKRQAISLFTHWLRYNLRIDELESTTLQSELTFLKNQINPHFLFNMLNNCLLYTSNM